MEDTRQKATPESHPGIGPATILVAYSELTQEAFAIWMRLHVADESEMSSGRGSIARMLGYSERRSNEVLRELSLKGYIGFEARRGYKTRVIIIRRALINARAHFARLSSLLVEGAEATARGGVFFHHVGNDTFGVGAGLTHRRFGLTQGEIWTYSGGDLDLLSQTSLVDSESGGTSCRPEAPDDVICATLAVSNASYDEVDDRVKFVEEGTYCVVKTSGTKVEIGALRSEKERLKGIRSVERSETTAAHARAAKIQGRVPGTIDWLALDKCEDPVLTFDPRSNRHPLFLAILNRSKNDKTRVNLVAKIETEFCRIYTRYRRDAERRRLTTSTYSISPAERHYAAEAGIQCLQRGVTPRRLLEYWDKNIGTFADRTMVLPPLSFLKSPAIVDRVAVSTFAETASGAPGTRAAVEAAKPVGGSSYANPGQLHPALRKTLEGGGYDTQSYSDRFLITVQHNALLIAAGKRVFLPAGKPKDMAEYAAAALYEET